MPVTEKVTLYYMTQEQVRDVERRLGFWRVAFKRANRERHRERNFYHAVIAHQRELSTYMDDERHQLATRDAARAVLDTVQPGPEPHLVCVDALALERLREEVGDAVVR